VDGRPARTTTYQDELTITPAAPVAAHARFVVRVTYGGVPRPYPDPHLAQVGFLSTKDGAFAVGEPRVAASWFPVNDHPSDKATYTIAIAAPDGLAALANGVLTARVPAAGWTTWTWTESAPMAPYLATVVIGQYRVHESDHDGRPVVTAVDPSLPTTVDDVLARTPEVVDYLATKFGPYPFDAMGGIAVADPRLKFALENQTRPVYAKGFFTNPQRAVSVVVHELAHQWYGDSVSVATWRDVWLNEGFATYAQWLWDADHGGRGVNQSFMDAYRTSPDLMWHTPPGQPPLDDLFTEASDSVYVRGAMTLHALRLKVGDDTFFRILRQWAQTEGGRSATTDDFVRLCGDVSKMNLLPLFDDWLFGTRRPALPQGLP
jgi:aminopeptidase N